MRSINLKMIFVVGLMSLGLSSCMTSPKRDDSPESDLDAILNGIKTRAKPRTLSNGKIYCVELSKTNGTHDECALELEDAFYSSEQDKKGVIVLAEKAIKRLKIQRKPCGIWGRTFNRDRCIVE